MKTQTTILLTVLFLAGCVGPPADNPLLLEARSIYNSAASDRAVLVNAQVELEEAQRELDIANQLWRDNGDIIQIEHHAHMARQRAKIAIETSRLKVADAEVLTADLERKQVQLEARSFEAERATETAERERALAEAAIEKMESARTDAERARLDAANAVATMEDMTAKLAEMQAKETERGLVLTLGDVLFDVGQSTMSSGGRRAAEQLAEFLLEYPERRVLIEGHTDSSGSEQTNQRLSEKRSSAVKYALMKRGIAASRIETTGFGESYPVTGNDSSAGRQQNRRVEVVISDENGVIKARN